MYSDRTTKPSPVSALCSQIHRFLAVAMPLLRVWVRCRRASNGLLPRRSNLVGYVRWDARSDRFLPCQTITPTAFQVAVCIASCIGSANALEFEHHREVCSVSDEVMLSPNRQRNLYLPDYRAAFAFSLICYPHGHRSILRCTFPLRGAMWIYPVPLE